MKYLVLNRGYMLNDIELEYGGIYPAEMFAKMSQHLIVGLILGGKLFRGTEEECQNKLNEFQGFSKVVEYNNEPEKERQNKMKKVKKDMQESLKESG